MQGILPYLISGISVGGQYALIAIGYTLVYGILRLINFAHGDVFMVAGLIMVYTTASMPMYISIPLVLIFTVILGFAIERVAYKPLRTAPRMSLMISAIGVSYLIQNLAFYLTGGLPQPVKTPIPWISDTVTIFGASTKRVTVVTPLLTVALVFALVALIKKTKIGMGMRGREDQFRHFHDLCHRLVPRRGRRDALLYELSHGGDHLRRYARPEGLRRGGVRRHRLHSRSGDRGLSHRHL